MHQNEHNAMSATKAAAFAAPKDCSPAQSKLNDLRSAQSFSQELLEQLEERLDLILAPQSTGASAETCPRSIPPSPICRELEDRCDSSNTLNRRIQSLIDRLTI